MQRNLDALMWDHYKIIRDMVMPLLKGINYHVNTDCVFKMIDSPDYTIDLLENIYSRYNND